MNVDLQQVADTITGPFVRAISPLCEHQIDCHVVPVTRGILQSCSVRLKPKTVGDLMRLVGHNGRTFYAIRRILETYGEKCRTNVQVSRVAEPADQTADRFQFLANSNWPGGRAQLEACIETLAGMVFPRCVSVFTVDQTENFVDPDDRIRSQAVVTVDLGRLNVGQMQWTNRSLECLVQSLGRCFGRIVSLELKAIERPKQNHQPRPDKRRPRQPLTADGRFTKEITR